MTQNRKFLVIAIIWSAFAALLTLLPYLAGHAVAPQGARFMWFIGNNLDQNSYMAWIKQGAEGRLLFEDKFTTEPQSGLFFFPFFLILGWICRLWILVSRGSVEEDPLWYASRDRWSLIFGGWVLLVWILAI